MQHIYILLGLLYTQGDTLLSREAKREGRAARCTVPPRPPITRLCQFSGRTFSRLGYRRRAVSCADCFRRF